MIGQNKTNPHTSSGDVITNGKGLELILRPEFPKPKNKEKKAFIYMTIELDEHPLGLAMLRSNKRLISTADDPDQLGDQKYPQNEERQLGYLANYVSRNFKVTEVPKMRVCTKKGRGLIFEISFQKPQHILITAPIQRKYQKYFARVFWYLDSQFRFGNIEGEHLIARFQN